MKQLSDGTTTPVIDASVHIFSKSNKDLRENFMQEPFRSRGFPDYEMDWYGAPGGEYVAGSKGPDRQYPGSDPALVGEELFTKRGVDVAILHPMTRGIMPDRHLGTAIAAAHNEMMVKRWLEDSEYGDKFRGTIRVDPNDIVGALREIDKYKDHPRVVQVGVPLQSRELYGKPQYWPLWEAATAANLPVAVHIEVGSGVSLPPTPSGNTRTYEQYLGFMSLNYLYHLMNMIAEGVFERMPSLRFVWADGAADLLDAVHLADGLLRPSPLGADAVGAEDAQRLLAGPRVLRARQPRRTRRRRLRKRMGRIHRQGRHDDVRVELSALELRRSAGTRQLQHRAARQAVLAQRRRAVRDRHSGRCGRTVEEWRGGQHDSYSQSTGACR